MAAFRETAGRGCGTPIEAMLEHLAAFSTGDDRRLAAVLSWPFVHLWPDGDLWRHDAGADVDLRRQYAKAGIEPGTFGWTELDEARLILDWDDLKAFCVRFTRYTRAGERIGESEAIWVTVRDGNGWRLKLRIGAARKK